MNDTWPIDAACRDTVARAARLVDQQDYEAFAALFTEDGVLQRPNAEPLLGRAAMVAAYRARPATRITRHLLAGTVVDVLSADEALAFSAVLLWVGDRADAEGPSGRPARGAQVAGEFEDRLRRGDDGRWRISHRIARFVLHAGGAA
jgi:ketosteroid isomerase-like protein